MCVPGEALVIEYRELVHRLAPLLGCAAPVGRDVAQGQPDQLGGGIVAGEVPPGADGRLSFEFNASIAFVV